MKIVLWLILSFVLPAEVARAECVIPADFEKSVVEIKRYNGYYDKYDSGSAWFYKDSRTLVTAAHVAVLLLLGKDWSIIELRQRSSPFTILEKTRARIIKMGDVASVPPESIAVIDKTAKEDLAIIELEANFIGAKPVDIAEGEAKYFSNSFSIAYPGGKFVTARGIILPPEIRNYNSGDFTPMLHFRVVPNRETLLVGASGSPIINCEGGVIGTLTIKMNDRFRLKDNILRIRPADSATNLGVPSKFIKELMERK